MFKKILYLLGYIIRVRSMFSEYAGGAGRNPKVRINPLIQVVVRTRYTISVLLPHIYISRRVVSVYPNR